MFLYETGMLLSINFQLSRIHIQFSVAVTEAAINFSTFETIKAQP